MMNLIDKINGWHPILISLGAIGFSFTRAEMGLRMLVLAVTLGYGIWKWWYEYHKSKKK